MFPCSIEQSGYVTCGVKRRELRSRSPDPVMTTLLADVPGIVAFLYAHGHLSFSRHEQIGGIYARHYHLLRQYMCEHLEVVRILGAID